MHPIKGCMAGSHMALQRDLRQTPHSPDHQCCGGQDHKEGHGQYRSRNDQQYLPWCKDGFHHRFLHVQSWKLVSVPAVCCKSHRWNWVGLPGLPSSCQAAWVGAGAVLDLLGIVRVAGPWAEVCGGAQVLICTAVPAPPPACWFLKWHNPFQS